MEEGEGGIIMTWIDYLIIAIMIIIFVIAMICGGVSIYCFITYGDLPITEVPSWALPFMFGK